MPPLIGMRRGALLSRADTVPPDIFAGLSAQPSGIFWTSRLRNAFGGAPGFRVRRSSDNAEAEFNFPGGVLDTAGILAFAASGDGLIAAARDQSGFARDVTQGTASFQQKIVSGGVLQTLNGNPVLLHSGTQKLAGPALGNYITASAYTIITVSRPAQGSGANYTSELILTESSQNIWHGAAGVGLTAGHYDASNATLTVDMPTSYPKTAILVSRLSGGVLSVWLNGGAPTSIAAGNVHPAALGGALWLGGTFTGPLLGSIIYPAALTLADLNALGPALAAYTDATWTTAT